MIVEKSTLIIRISPFPDEVCTRHGGLSNHERCVIYHTTFELSSSAHGGEGWNAGIMESWVLAYGSERAMV